jgi:hypothetical protein
LILLEDAVELKEFVTETLIAILEGVDAAINRADESKLLGVINPLWADEGEKMDWKDYVQPVEFDIAVTATDKVGGGGKASIKLVTVAELSADGSKGTEHSTVNRIKFSIPIVPTAKPRSRK